MDKILIATDLDGTLLNDQSRVSDYTMKVITRILDKGALFVPTTARSESALLSDLLESDIRYYICSNGATIWDNDKEEVVVSNKLDVSLATSIMNLPSSIIKSTNIIVDGVVYSEPGTINMFEHYKLDSEIITEIMEDRVVIESALEFISEYDHIEKLHFNFKEKEDRDAFQSLVPESDAYIVTSSDDINLEITNRKATKGLAILELCNYLNQEDMNITTFGDNLNDIPMFEIADTKVAMSNGQEALIEMADVVTKYTNDEDGVGKSIVELFELKDI